MAISRKVVIPYLVEFISQFMHTFWGVMATYPKNNGEANVVNNVSNETSVLQIPEEPDYFRNTWMPAFQAGTSVFMQIIWSWKLGAAHFNPAVSLGFLVAGKLKVFQFVCYVIIQCIASIAAALAAKLICGGQPGHMAVDVTQLSWVSVATNEFLTTGFLVFFIMCIAMDATFDNPLGPLAIGLTVFQGILTSQIVGVSCISPSNAFGPAILAGDLSGHWIFWLFDLLGGAVAAVAYMICFANDDICWLSDKSNKKRNDSTKSELQVEEHELIRKQNNA